MKIPMLPSLQQNMYGPFDGVEKLMEALNA